jgi:hypothetical protein
LQIANGLNAIANPISGGEVMKLADSGAGVATVLVGLLTIFAVAVAVDGYVEWSSDAALAEFISAANVSASDTNNPSSSSADQSDKGPTGCPVGKRKLPTQVRPLP